MRKAKKGGKPERTSKKGSIPEDDAFLVGDDSDEKEAMGSEGEEENDDETPEAKRLRMTKEYLASLKAEASEVHTYTTWRGVRYTQLGEKIE